MINMFAIALGPPICWYLALAYLKYQFKQINEQIEQSFKTGNSSKLMNAIIRHNSVTQNTKRLNLTLKYFTFMLYYFVRPVLNILIFITHSPDTNFYARFAAGVVVVFGFIVLYIVNYICASVSSAAHKSYPMMYSFLNKHKRNIGIKRKLKIQDFIEKLSGSEIGIYCYDLFPMNNYEFFDFISSWATNYILIIGFL